MSASARARPVRAVCFDVDDTLVDFTSAGRRALASMLGRDDLWPLWERSTERHVALVVAGRLDYAAMHRLRSQYFLAELGVRASAEEAARFERARAALVECHWGLYPDVLGCLERLRGAGLDLAAVTNASGAHQRRKLHSLELSHYFAHIAIAGEVGASKPESLLFHSACAALDRLPGEVMHIGDKFEADALGARDAGLRAVWLDRRGEAAGAAVAAANAAQVRVINSLEELRGNNADYADWWRTGVEHNRVTECNSFTASSSEVS